MKASREYNINGETTCTVTLLKCLKENRWKHIITVHRQWSFPLRISSVNVTKSARNWNSSLSCGKLPKSQKTSPKTVKGPHNMFGATFWEVNLEQKR